MNIYKIMLMISILCMAGDSDSFMMFLIWHAVWFMVFVFCVNRLERTEE